MATSSPHIASLLSSSGFHSNSYLCLPATTRTGTRTRTRTRSLPSLTPISHNLIQTKKFIIFHNPSFLTSQRSNRLRPTPAAAAEDVVPSDAAAVEATQQLVSNNDDGVSTVVSALLLIAFIGLSILTVGVIYLGVTDFLQKREKEKFEKEEAANKSGKKKKKKVGKARAGPRGFGQKIDDDEDDD